MTPTDNTRRSIKKNKFIVRIYSPDYMVYIMWWIEVIDVMLMPRDLKIW